VKEAALSDEGKRKKAKGTKRQPKSLMPKVQPSTIADPQDPFLWLYHVLNVELPARQGPLLPPEKDPEDEDGIPVGPASEKLQRLQSLIQDYEANALECRAKARRYPAGSSEKLHWRCQAERFEEIAEVLDTILDFCLRDPYRDGGDYKVWLTPDWTVRVEREE
jgi:hypothetical protein